MGCGCGQKRTPMVGQLVDPQSASVTAASSGVWRITYVDGSTEETTSLLEARRKARAKRGTVSVG